MPIQIRLQHYAIFREIRGAGEELIATEHFTPRQIYHDLGLDQAIPLDPERLRVAVNDEVVPWDHRLTDGDLLVFLAPMAGG
jgi:sulfur-carrier protein